MRCYSVVVFQVRLLVYMHKRRLLSMIIVLALLLAADIIVSVMDCSLPPFHYVEPEHIVESQYLKPVLISSASEASFRQ